MDYESMSIEELEAENNRLKVQRDAIKMEQRKIVDIINLKQTQAKLDNMTEAELAAIKQIVGK